MFSSWDFISIQWGGMPHMGWYGMGWAGAILIFLFWVLVIVGLVFLILRLTERRKTGGDEALEILRRKFAAGEISKEEFEEKKKILLGK